MFAEEIVQRLERKAGHAGGRACTDRSGDAGGRGGIVAPLSAQLVAATPRRRKDISGGALPRWRLTEEGDLQAALATSARQDIIERARERAWKASKELAFKHV